MCGQSGTFDPFWYDLGSFMSKTHVFDRELELTKYSSDLCKNRRIGNFVWNFRIFGEKHINLALTALKSAFWSKNRFFQIIIDYKNSIYLQNTTDIKKSALPRCKVTILEYIAWNPIL